MEPQGQERVQQALPQAPELEPEQAQRGSPLASELPQQELEPEQQALPQAPWEPPLFSPQQVLRPSFPQVPEHRRRKLQTSMQRQSPPKVR